MRTADATALESSGRGFFSIHEERHFRMWRLDVPIGIHNAGRLVEDRLHLAGHLHPPSGIRSVDFGDERLQDGRPRRNALPPAAWRRTTGRSAAIGRACAVPRRGSAPIAHLSTRGSPAGRPGAPPGAESSDGQAR